MNGIPTRFAKGEILKFGKNFLEIRYVERLPKMTWNNSSSTFAATTANTYAISALEPNANYLTHIEKIGIDGYLQCQLFFPESNPRGSVKGISERFDYKTAPFQNPLRWTFFVPQDFPPYLNVYNPKSYAITSTVYFFGYYYHFQNLGSAIPIIPETGQKKPYTIIDNYIPGVPAALA